MNGHINAWIKAAIAPEQRKSSYTPREIADLDEALCAAGGDRELLPKAGGELVIATWLSLTSRERIQHEGQK